MLNRRVWGLLAAVLVVWSVQPSSSQSTSLVIYAVDPATGSPVDLSTAEVYIDPWGGGETYTVRPRGSEVRIPLDAAWPCSQDPGWCGGRHVLDARITLRAEGYEHVRSDHFPWLTGAGHNTAVRFPGNRERTIGNGQTVTLTIPFRRPTERRLRLVDAADRPVSDAHATIRELYSQTNHCGWPEGIPAWEGSPDRDGYVRLPPGEVEFWVQVKKAGYVVVPTPRYDLNWVTGRFDAPESRIRLRPMQQRPLDLEFRNGDGSPAVVKIWAMGTGCGSAGLLGTTNSEGRFSLRDFYPEEVMELFVGEHGNWRWHVDPRKEKWTGRRVFYLDR